MANHTHEQAADMLDAELDKLSGLVATAKFLGFLIGHLTARHPDSVVDAIRAYKDRERA